MEKQIAFQRSYEGSNDVWHFLFLIQGQEHLVRIGDYITCTCRGDLQCKALVRIVQKIFINKDVKKEDLISPIGKMKLKCPICLQTRLWKLRGADYCFCKRCLQPYDKDCIQDCIKHRILKCETCNETLDSMSSLFMIEESNMDCSDHSSKEMNSLNEENLFDLPPEHPLCDKEIDKMTSEEVEEYIKFMKGDEVCDRLQNYYPKLSPEEIRNLQYEVASNWYRIFE